MVRANLVYLYVWSGDARQAREAAAVRYPGAEMRLVAHRQLRELPLAGRIRLLRSLRGRAIVFYFRSITDLRYHSVMPCVHLLHGCAETILCDSAGVWQGLRTSGVLRAAPGLLYRVLRDACTLAGWWAYLQVRQRRCSPVPFHYGNSEPQVAYLLPTTQNIGASGGAMSHIRGFLTGLRQSGKSCRLFTGVPLAQEACANEIIAERRRPYFFWQAALLTYNFTFAAGVRRLLAADVPAAFYQRHTRFSIAGALLSRSMRVPLILEYNGPEVWIAEHWDPSPFRSLIALCEQVSLRSATRIVVVSKALKAGLIERGFTAERIRVNPNGVDLETFKPGASRASGRSALGVQPGEVLVAFVGSFSLWHGIEVLQQAIASLLSNPQPERLRFVLIGEGLLQQEMRSALAPWEQTGEVLFTGSLPPATVVEYLDAADILVSPHIPMPDGSRFFGSPTKLFEYMAMGKAIVASRLEQLAEALSHGETAWLVAPGNAEELAQAILLLAQHPAQREVLGAAARRAALAHHSWKQNVVVALKQDQPDSSAADNPARSAGWPTRAVGSAG